MKLDLITNCSNHVDLNNRAPKTHRAMAMDATLFCKGLHPKIEHDMLQSIYERSISSVPSSRFLHQNFHSQIS